MLRLIKFVLGVLGLAIVVGVGFGIMRTMKSERSANQTIFLSGTAVLPAPGFYQGAATSYKGSWRGKFVEEGSQRGANVFEETDSVTGESESQHRRYPFALYPAKGLRDGGLDVIVLDYNQAGNPWWLRYVTDEIVQTSPTTYLGKLHIKITPKIVFTMGYFTLQQPIAEPTSDES